MAVMADIDEAQQLVDSAPANVGRTFKINYGTIPSGSVVHGPVSTQRATFSAMSTSLNPVSSVSKESVNLGNSQLISSVESDVSRIPEQSISNSNVCMNLVNIRATTIATANISLVLSTLNNPISQDSIASTGNISSSQDSLITLMENVTRTIASTTDSSSSLDSLITITDSITSTPIVHSIVTTANLSNPSIHLNSGDHINNLNSQTISIPHPHLESVNLSSSLNTQTISNFTTSVGDNNPPSHIPLTSSVSQNIHSDLSNNFWELSDHNQARSVSVNNLMSPTVVQSSRSANLIHKPNNSENFLNHGQPNRYEEGTL